MGLGENESFMKQRTLLSLSKLSLLADNVSDLAHDLENLNRKLDYLQYIDTQAVHISNNYGLIIDQIPAYNAEKLIDVCLKKLIPSVLCFFNYLIFY